MEPEERIESEDLAALFARITRRLLDAERPVFAAHGLSMWGYIALSQLARRHPDTQLALARAIGHDKTRLIALLDELERAGLITRKPDPADRRVRKVRLTAAGEAGRAAVQAGIRLMEAEFLGDLSAAEQGALRAVLTRLAGQRQP